MKKRKDRLEREFVYAMELLGDYLRSGYSVENALLREQAEIRATYGEESLILPELRRIGAKIRLGGSVEEAFGEFAERTGSESIESFSQVFGIVKRNGGDLGEIIGRVTAELGTRFAVREHIDTALAAKKLEQKIMDLMPAGVLIYVKLTSPDLMENMYRTPQGRVVMTVCLAVYGAAFLWSRKITDIQMGEA